MNKTIEEVAENFNDIQKTLGESACSLKKMEADEPKCSVRIISITLMVLCFYVDCLSQRLTHFYYEVLQRLSTSIWRTFKWILLKNHKNPPIYS